MFNRGVDSDEIDHSESDVGINDDNPNFDGNEFVFNKGARDKHHSIGKGTHQGKGGAGKKSSRKGHSNSRAMKGAGKTQSSMSGAEDLEANVFYGGSHSKGKGKQ